MGVNNVQNPDFRLYRESTGDYLFVLFKVDTTVYSAEDFTVAKPGSCILYGKTGMQGYYPNGTNLIHDFIHFDFDSEQECSVYSGIPQNRLMYLSDHKEITDILTEISRTMHSPGEYRAEILNHLGNIFLLKLKQQLKVTENEKIPYLKELTALRAEIYNNPKKYQCIQDMLPAVNISSSYLQALYKKHFGISCINDIIKARINLAKHMLLHYDMSIAEISEVCGYNNVEHFIRQFRKAENTPPLQYKKNISGM